MSNYESIANFKIAIATNLMGNNYKNTVYVESKSIYKSKEIQLHPRYGFREKIFSENLVFLLQWQPIKISNLNRIPLVGSGLRMTHFDKTFIKISRVTQK